MYKPKIFYTASFTGKSLYQKYYDMVLNAILETDSEVISTELGNYKKILTNTDLSKIRTKEEEHYLAIKKGIKWADLIILELSHESFQVGHEATLALSEKKHVLGLSVNKDWSKYILNDYFEGIKYNEYNVKKSVEDFLNKFSNPQMNERLNLFLTPNQLAKLSRVSKEKGLNKSELIRSLIDKA